MPLAEGPARVLDQAREICAIPAPTFDEEERAGLVMRLFEVDGLQARRDAAGNVVCRLGGDGEAVVLAAHLDTVFGAGTEIRFAESPGRLAAPGLGDNSLGVAALLHLGRHLRDRPPRRPVVLAATVGEEGLGDLRGAKALLDELPCRAFVAVEGQGLDGIGVAAVGSLRLQVQVRGPGGHPWGDRGTVSAAHWLIRALAAALERAASLDVVLNVGVIEAGTVINAIAGQARAALDLRAAEPRQLQALREVVHESLAAPQELEVEVRTVGERPAGAIAPGDPLLIAARRARERAGLPPAEESASSTDANAAHGRGIPALTVAVTTGGNAHRLDEYIDTEPVGAGLAALEALLDEVAGR